MLIAVASYSVHVTVGGLWELLVGQHFVFESDEAFLHALVVSPLLENGEAGFDVAVGLVDGGDVDLRVELDHRRRGRIVLAALDRQEVNSIVEVGAGRPDDRTVPLREGLVVTLIEAVGHTGVLEVALLCLFKFLVQLKRTWHYISLNSDSN